MYNNKRVAALIAAAGQGRRMGANKPKQFLKLGNKTLLEKTTEAFNNNASVDDIYIVTGKDDVSNVQQLLSKDSGFKKIKGIFEGGDSRQESVYNGLERIDENTDIVLIHDAARPYISNQMIQEIVAMVDSDGASIPAIPLKDTVKEIEDGKIISTPDRNRLRGAQTPQGFKYPLIKQAHEKATIDGFMGTDDAQLVERLGRQVTIIQGEEKNIKITTKEDMPPHNDKQTDILVGLGFDVHAFSEGRNLILGGVHIPYEKGLLGHSDADVLTHAFMDAILGALNLGDIGSNFPDTDDEYKDISSVILLKKVAELMNKKGYTIKNADLIIVAEKPKMKKYKKLMADKMAQALKIEPQRISVKATTTEGLGFTGREEGIGAQAIVQLIRY